MVYDDYSDAVRGRIRRPLLLKFYFMQLYVDDLTPCI